jgi:SAM-dependent methyltransferase
MERTPAQYWDGAHEKYANTDWINQPTMFAEWIIQYLPPQGKVLDAGCGQGQDSRFFAAKGYDVTGVDFAHEGIRRAVEKTPPELAERITFQQVDLSFPLPFADEEFDIVHSHLAAHYFSEKVTQQLFDEFARVLKRGGTLTLLLNSVHDAEYGTGEKIEEGLYLVDGIAKRYFSAETLPPFVEKAFEPIVLDESGETYKDRAVGNSNLVRFVGRKR